MAVPNDPVILLSYVNTQLRDFYSSLTELCQSLNLDEKQLNEKLKTINYEYNAELNQFK